MIQEKKTRRVLWFFAVLLVLIQFYPMMNLSQNGMQVYEGAHVTIHYMKEDANIIQEVADYMETEIARINAFFEIENAAEIYLYPSQEIFHKKKYGTIVELVNIIYPLDWYIGDNLGELVLAVSPQAKLAVHDKKSVYGMLGHEYVHTVIHKLQPEMKLWLDEGLALYLTNGIELSDIEGVKLPTFDDMQTNNPIEFAETNGYLLAHTYISYLSEVVGEGNFRDTIIKGESFEESFGFSEQDAYRAWIEHITSN